MIGRLARMAAVAVLAALLTLLVFRLASGLGALGGETDPGAGRRAVVLVLAVVVALLAGLTLARRLFDWSGVRPLAPALALAALATVAVATFRAGLGGLPGGGRWAAEIASVHPAPGGELSGGAGVTVEFAHRLPRDVCSGGLDGLMELWDERGSVVPATLSCSRNRRRVTLRPQVGLASETAYTVRFAVRHPVSERLLETDGRRYDRPWRYRTPPLPGVRLGRIHASTPDGDGRLEVIGLPGALAADSLARVLLLDCEGPAAAAETRVAADGGFAISVGGDGCRVTTGSRVQVASVDERGAEKWREPLRFFVDAPGRFVVPRGSAGALIETADGLVLDIAPGSLVTGSRLALARCTPDTVEPDVPDGLAATDAVCFALGALQWSTATEAADLSWAAESPVVLVPAPAGATAGSLAFLVTAGHAFYREGTRPRYFLAGIGTVVERFGGLWVANVPGPARPGVGCEEVNAECVAGLLPAFRASLEARYLVDVEGSWSALVGEDVVPNRLDSPTTVSPTDPEAPALHYHDRLCSGSVPIAAQRCEAFYVLGLPRNTFLAHLERRDPATGWISGQAENVATGEDPFAGIPPRGVPSRER